MTEQIGSISLSPHPAWLVLMGTRAAPHNKEAQKILRMFTYS